MQKPSHVGRVLLFFVDHAHIFQCSDQQHIDQFVSGAVCLGSQFIKTPQRFVFHADSHIFMPILTFAIHS